MKLLISRPKFLRSNTLSFIICLIVSSPPFLHFTYSRVPITHINSLRSLFHIACIFLSLFQSSYILSYALWYLFHLIFHATSLDLSENFSLSIHQVICLEDHVLKIIISLIYRLFFPTFELPHLSVFFSHFHLSLWVALFLCVCSFSVCLFFDCVSY